MLWMKVLRIINSPSKNLYYHFSTSLSEAAQRAVWAFQIGQLIENAKPSNKIEDSLHAQILNVSIKDKTFSFSEQIRNQSLLMFTEGIKLNKQFSQTRVILARQNNQNFIFFPTFLVAPKIFSLLKRIGSHQLVFGGFGIAKTISIILYCHLYYPLHKFIYWAKSNEEAKKQLNMLKQLNLLKDVPKFWYWNIDFKQIQQQNNVLQNLIFSQTLQLSQSQREKLRAYINKPKRFKSKLKQLYDQTEIKRYCLIDNINLATSRIREWNIIIQKYLDQLINNYYQEKKLLKNTIQNQKKLKQLLKKRDKIFKELRRKQKQNKAILKSAGKIQQMINLFGTYGIFCTYNSSMNIQSQLIGKRPFTRQYLLQIQDEEAKAKLNEIASKRKHLILVRDQQKQIIQTKILFQNQIKKQWGQNQFYNFLWFQLSRILKQTPIKATVITQIQKYFYQNRKIITIKNFYRIFHIRQNIAQIKNKFLQFTDKSTFEDVAKAVKQLMDSFKETCIKNARQRLYKFVYKGDDEAIETKIKFLHTIFILATLQKQRNTPLQFEFAKIDFIIGSKSKIKDYLLSPYHNKDVLPIQLQQSEKQFALMYTGEQFIEVARQVMFATSQRLYSNLTDPLLYKRLQSNPSILGTLFQQSFRSLLKPGSIVHFKMLTNNLMFSIDRVSKFISMSPPKCSFQQHFKEISTEAKQTPNKIIVGFPFSIQNKNNNQQEAFSSNVIDLVFVQYQKEYQRYMIHTVNVSPTVGSLDKKIKDAKDFFIDIYRSTNLSIQLKHVIFGFELQENQFIQKITRQEYDHIVFASIEQFYLQRYSDPSWSYQITRFYLLREMASSIMKRSIQK